MKKALSISTLVFSLLLTTGLQLHAQAYRPTRMFRHGQADAWFGIGLLPTYAKDGARMAVPPVSAGVDWMVSDQFSLGGGLGYSNYEMEKLPVGVKEMRHYGNQTYQFMARAAAHFTQTDNLDLYGGFQLGAQLVQVTSLDGPFGPVEDLYGIRPQKTRFLYGAYLGLRFAISPKTSLFGEVGTGISIAVVGVGWRMDSPR